METTTDTAPGFDSDGFRLGAFQADGHTLADDYTGGRYNSDGSLYDADDDFPTDYDFDYVDAYGDDVLGDPWNDIDQGRYDDDPNPYHGDYSEW